MAGASGGLALELVGTGTPRSGCRAGGGVAGPGGGGRGELLRDAVPAGSALGDAGGQHMRTAVGGSRRTRQTHANVHSPTIHTIDHNPKSLGCPSFLQNVGIKLFCLDNRYSASG